MRHIYLPNASLHDPNSTQTLEVSHHPDVRRLVLLLVQQVIMHFERMIYIHVEETKASIKLQYNVASLPT